KQNTLVYHEADEKYTVELSKTRSKAYIFINIDSSLTSEVRYINADRPKDHFHPILPRMQGTEYDVTHHAESFFIRTNDGAKTFRVVEAPVKDPSKPHWKEIVPGRKDVTVEGVNSFHDYLVIEERDNGLNKIRVRKFEKGELAAPVDIEFPDPVYTASVGD